MPNHYYAPMRDRYAKNKVFPVETYQEFEWDGKSFLLTYVTEFYDRWMDAYAYGGVTHHAGISRLIHTLPSPWSEWTAQAALPYTWFSPPEYKPRGDIIGLIGVLLPAMAAARDGPPLSPPAHKYPPGQARRWRYRRDKEPHVDRVPNRPRLKANAANPLVIHGNVEDMRAITPPPPDVGEYGENEGPDEEGPALEMDEDDDPEEDMNDID